MGERWGQEMARGAVIPLPATEVPPPPPPPGGLGTHFRLTFVATEETPERYRRYHGTCSPPIPLDTLIPVEGGTLMGVPGRLVGDTWEMTAPRPEPVDHGPPWARALAAQLEEIKALLADRPNPHDR